MVTLSEGSAFSKEIVQNRCIMALSLCVLASGSSGNCIYVASSRTRILIDAGLSGKETARRLDHIGISADSVHAVCVTHEHDDHRASLGVLQRRHGVNLYANNGTIEAMRHVAKLQQLEWNVFTTGVPFEVGDFSVEPFSVPHDSYDPVGFVLSCDGFSVGIVTDMGMPTELIRERLRRCQALVIEANHDEQMLRDAERPWSLKQRIAGRQGHLSNEQAAELVAGLAGDHLKVVFLAHLSSDCNRPDLARDTVCRALEKRGVGHVDVRLTYPERPTELFQS